MAQMFVQAVSSGSKDQIWTAGAERFVTFFLKCLRRRPAEENTLHNLYYLFQNFGEDGRALHRFVADSCIDPVTGDADPFMVNEWKSLLSVHKDGILSFIMNATASLKIFANPDVCKLTARSDIDLGTLRKQKTIIYLTVPPQYQKMYRPVTSMYFLSILQACMERTPNRSDLPVYFLWDEFGNSYLPDFEIFATTVREYRISLMLFMQGINQLETAYGKTISHDILSGVATQISFGSAEQATAEFFSRRAGKIRVIQKPNLKDPHLENYGERNLINPNEVRELGASKALVIAANFKTTLLDFTPSYLHSRFKKYMKTKPTVVRQSGSDRIDFIQL
jgi:type IV secretory pathway TraG/TraD family ATPase VirD4